MCCYYVGAFVISQKHESPHCLGVIRSNVMTPHFITVFIVRVGLRCIINFLLFVSSKRHWYVYVKLLNYNLYVSWVLLHCKIFYSVIEIRKKSQETAVGVPFSLLLSVVHTPNKYNVRKHFLQRFGTIPILF